MASQELPETPEIPETPENEQIPVEEQDTEELHEQDKFAYESLGKILGLVALCGVSCAFLFIIFLILSPIRSPGTLFFQATPAGQLIQDTPLDKPNVTLNILLNWVTQGMMKAHTLNFMNYTTVAEDVRTYFTKDGFDSYLNALKDNKIIEQIVAKKYVLRAFPVSAPQITKEGVLANFYLWKIKLPMTFRYKNVDSDRYDDVELTLLVVRVPSTDEPYGIKILKYDLLLKSKASDIP